MFEEQESIEKYYEITSSIQNIYMDSGSNLSGYFKNESLEIGTEGISLEFGREIKSFFETYDETDFYKKQKISKLISDNIEVKNTLKMIQTFSHEAFHLLQALTLRVSNEFIYNIRKMKDIEFIVFAYVIDSGLSWKFKKHRNILSIVQEIDNPDFTVWISKKLKKAKYSSFDIFTNYKDNSNNISILDLIEGSAVAFQEMGSRSIDEKLFLFKENTIYTKAFDFFKKEIKIHVDENQKKFLFLLISYSSLKYGFCSYFNNQEPDNPYNIFLFLINNIEKINNENMNVTSRKLEGLVGYNSFSTLSKNHIIKIEKEASNESIALINNAVFSINKINDLIFSYYSSYGNPDLINVGIKLDRKMKPLSSYMEDSFPMYDTPYIVPFLIHDLKYFTEFSAKLGNSDYDSISVETINGKNVEFWLDSGFSSCMNDFNDLLSEKGCYCCDEHGIISRNGVIMNCTNPNSLLDRMRIFGENTSIKKLLGF